MASSPTKLIGSTQNLNLYNAGDSIEALQEAINGMKPPLVIDNAHVETRFAEYSDIAFSSNQKDNEKIQHQVVRDHLADDFLQMAGNNYSEALDRFEAQADKALNQFLKNKKFKFEISDPKLRVNYERMGFYYQQTESEEQVLDGFALSINAVAFVGIEGYRIPADKYLEMRAIFNLKERESALLTIKAKIERYDSQLQDFVGIDFPLAKIYSRHGGGFRILDMIDPSFISKHALELQYRQGNHILKLPATEVLTRHQTIPLAIYIQSVSEINNYIFEEDEEGIIKGTGIIHPHNIEPTDKLARNKRMVFDLLRNKSLRNHLSKDFEKFAREVKANTEIDPQEFQGFLSVTDFLTIFNDEGLNVEGSRTSILFSVIAEIEEYSDKIKGVNIVDPTRTDMSVEEINYRVKIAREARDAIIEAVKDNSYKIKDPKKAAAVVEHYLGMKDITIRDKMPDYVND